MTAIILDINKPDPSQPTLLNPDSPAARRLQPWLLFHGDLQFHVNSGDECSYEFVEHERLYYVDTNAQKGVLVLPPNPHDGFKLLVSDRFGSWIYYPLIIHRNGKPIMGLEEHMTCDVPNMIFALVYTNTAAGWVVSNDLSTSVFHENVTKGFFQ